MRINVTVNEVQMIDSEILNVNEYNVHKCEFVFAEEYEGLTKKAVFTNKDGQSYLQTIVNNECSIPAEVLNQKDSILIGVYAYEMNGQELALRYSPKPTKAYIDYGSYKEAENSEPPTPTEVEQLQGQITQNANDIDTLETNVAGITTDISDIQAEQRTQNTNIQNNTNNILTNTQDIADIKTEQTEQNTKIQNNTDDITALNNTKADKSEIPTKTSDLTNDSGFIDKTVNDLDNYTKTSELSNVATSGDYNDLNNKPSIPTKTSDLTNDSGFINKNVNDLINYTLKTNTGSLIDLEINQSTYVITLSLKNQDGNIISTDTIDLPLESVVVGGSYDAVNKKIVLTLENGNTVDIPVGDLVAGLQTEITSSNKLASDLVDDTNSGNKFVNTTEKQTWNGKYDKPVGGIPKTDLDSNVQTSLSKADTAIQEHQDLTDYVKNTDYASGSKGGTVKINTFYGVKLYNNGIIAAIDDTYSRYTDYYSRETFISKGTLENVISGKQLINQTQLDESQQSQDELIAELEEENENLRNAFPSVSGQGTNIKLEGTAKARFKKFVIDGNEWQAQYEGRNLLPIISANSISRSGITLTSNGDGSFTANGTATQEDTIIFDFDELFTLPNETLYWHIRNNGIAECSLYLEGNNISSSPSFSIVNRIMTSSNLTNLSPTKFGIHFNNGVTLNNIKFTPSIELTDEITNYEPYVGGQKSPSPQFLQPIKSVVGEIKNKIQNKNLFDLGNSNDYFLSYNNGKDISNIPVSERINVTIGNDKIIFNSYNNTGYMWLSRFIKLKKNKNYYLSGNYTLGQIIVVGLNENSVNSQGTVIRTNTGTFNSGDYNYYMVSIYPTSIEGNTFENIMIEQGTTATPYVPHAEQNLPFTLEEGERMYQGSKLEDDGKHHRSREVVLDGTENWENWARPQNYGYLLTGFTDRIQGATQYCTHLIQDYGKAYDGEAGYFGITADGLLNVCVDEFDTIEKWKQFLAEQYANGTPVKIVYKLATEQIVPYTPLQQTQYNAIKKAHSENDITYIESKSDELGAILDVKAVQDMDTKISNLESRLALLE